jgi:hypothetical protein
VADRIPAVVRVFVAEYIDSVAVLEMLLLLRRETKRDWSAAAVSRELKLERSNVELRLEQLKNEGLLGSRKSGADRVYRYEPSSPDVESAVEQLAECYAWKPVALMAAIFSGPEKPPKKSSRQS